MTQEEARKAAEVMLAYANGEKIESFCCGKYVPCGEPTFNWFKGVKSFRIKTKEKFNPKTLKPFDKVVVSNEDSKWKCGLFSHIIDSASKYKYSCIGSAYVYCIPYNKDTKHLVGTTKEAPEYYRYWED